MGMCAKNPADIKNFKNKNWFFLFFYFFIFLKQIKPDFFPTKNLAST